MQISNPKVSIIVPVHNAGERLYKCLDTLVNQTLREIEIILVLDCPTDGSDRIAEEYAAKDDRIVILKNPENLHIGKSRNRGLEMAHGEFIGFSDHDDYRELTMYEELYAEATEKKADVVLSLLENDKNLKEDFVRYGDIVYSKDFILKDLIGFGYENNPGALFVRVTGNLYKKSLLKLNQINFVDTLTTTPEDVIFQIKSILRSENLALIKKQFYFHQKHTDNEGNKGSYVSFEKRGAGMAEIYSLLIREKVFDYFRHYFYKGVTKQFLNALAGTVYPKFSISQFVRGVKLLRSYPFCNEAFAVYSLPPAKHKWLRMLLVKMLK